jgi:hypothetical protein
MHLVTEDEDLIVRTEDGTQKTVRVGRTELLDPDTDEVLVYDINKGKYETIISSGPSFASKRDEAAQAGLELIGALPEVQKAAISPAIVAMQDWPDAERVSKVLVASLPPELQAAYKEEEQGVEEIPQQAKAMMDQMAQELQASQGEAQALADQIKQMAVQIEQLNTALISNERDAIAKERVALINAQAKLEAERIQAGQQTQNTLIESATQKEIAAIQTAGELNAESMRAAGALKQEAVRGLANLQSGPSRPAGFDGVMAAGSNIPG